MLMILTPQTPPISCKRVEKINKLLLAFSAVFITTNEIHWVHPANNGYNNKPMFKNGGIDPQKYVRIV